MNKLDFKNYSNQRDPVKLMSLKPYMQASIPQEIDGAKCIAHDAKLDQAEIDYISSLLSLFISQRPLVASLFDFYDEFNLSQSWGIDEEGNDIPLPKTQKNCLAKRDLMAFGKSRNLTKLNYNRKRKLLNNIEKPTLYTICCILTGSQLKSIFFGNFSFILKLLDKRTSNNGWSDKKPLLTKEQFTNNQKNIVDDLKELRDTLKNIKSILDHKDDAMFFCSNLEFLTKKTVTINNINYIPVTIKLVSNSLAVINHNDFLDSLMSHFNFILKRKKKKRLRFSKKRLISTSFNNEFLFKNDDISDLA